MRRLTLVLLAAAGACGDEEPTAPPLPEEWEPLGCGWEDRTGGGGESASEVTFASGGLVIGGRLDDPDTRARAYWLRGYSAAGDVTWTSAGTLTVYSGEIHALALDRDDRIGVTGIIEEPNYRFDMWVAAFDASGEPAWSIDLDNAGRGADACFAPTGELYVAGTVVDPDYRSASLIWVGKFSAGGELLWSDTGDDPRGRQHDGRALVCDDDGGVTVLGGLVVPGGPGSIGPDTHTWIRRYDGDGAVRWTTILGEEFESYYPGQMLADPAGDGLLVTAGSNLLRIDPVDGAVTEELPGPPGVVMAVDVDGTYIEGNFSRQVDPECDELQDGFCERIYYWGYAHVDWQGQPIWWRADTTGIPDDESSWVAALRVGEDGAIAVAGRMQDDAWVCYR